MVTTTISTAITAGVTIGTGAYAGTGTLIITSNGAISTTGSGVYGVSTPLDQGDIYISNAGFITASFGGVHLENATDTFSNSGSIIAAFQPLELDGGVVTNSGYIEATNDAAYGVSVVQGVLTNTGSIAGFFGAGLSSSATTLDNLGNITGKYEGVFVYNEATLINAGVLRATGSYSEGVFLRTGLVDNSGDITGVYGIAFGDTRSIVTATLITSGTIEGTSGTAVNAYGQLLLTVLPGAVFDGSVKNSDNDTTLALGGTGQSSLDISGFTGLAGIDFTPGAAWTLEGGTNQLAAGESIGGFTLGDTLVLDGFSATGSSYISGTGLVLSNATAAETLNITGSFGTNAFTATEANGDTTITALISTISTYVYLGDRYLTLGSGGYDTNLTITNTGSLVTHDLFGAGIRGNNGTVTNAGTIDGGVGLGIGTVINTGFIDKPVYLGSGVVVDAGQISAAPDLSNAISAQSSLTVILEPGAAILGAIDDAGGDGTLVLDGNDPNTIFFGGPADRGLVGISQISFASGQHDLSVSLGDVSNGVTLDGFGSGDTLRLSSNLSGSYLIFSSASYVTGTGIVATTTDDVSTTLAINGGPPAGGFAFAIQDSGDEIEITAACFCRGTRIATPRGKLAVERLSIGDVVVTDLGPATIKWIGRRAYQGNFIAGNHLALPIRIRRHALSFNVPSRDVFLSPDHGVCEGRVFVPAWRLVNGVSITQAASVERVEYFHIELEKPAVIFAENMPVESFVDADCRQRFQNASEYDLLYPEPTPPQQHARPRIEDGFLLQRIGERINARAGLPPATQTFGPLRGCIDETSPRLRGWAQDATAPETPVLLEILHNGTSIGTLIANHYRPDLRKAGLGSGCHAFNLQLPPLPGTITLRRLGDAAAQTLAA